MQRLPVTKLLRNPWFSCWIMVACVGVFGGKQAWAHVLHEVFQPQREVANTTPEARHQAVEAAWHTLLRQLMVHKAITQDPTLKPLLDQPERWLSWYRYVSEGQQLRLAMGFAQEPILKALQEQKRPYWSNKRPWVVVWVSEHTPSGVRWMNSDDPRRVAVQAAAAHWQIPVILPEWDLSLMAQVVDDADVLAQLSERYHTDSWLWAQITPDTEEEGWSVRWVHGWGSERWSSLFQAPTWDELWQEGVYRTSLNCMQHLYHVQQQPAVNWSLEVEGVEEMATYQAVVRYLSALPQVHQVRAEHVGDHQVRFKVRLAGGLPSLLKIFALDDMMVPLATTASDALRVRWDG